MNTAEIEMPMTEIPKRGDRRIELCPVHGKFEEIYFQGVGGMWRDGWSGCDKCREDYNAACKEASRRRDARDRAARCLCATNVPSRYRRKTLENFAPQTDDQRAALNGAKAYVENWAENYAVARCLSFIGPVGVGKTHLACAVLTALAEKGHAAKYITALDFIYEIRATWKNSEPKTAAAVVEKYQRPELLLIDDVGCLTVECEHVRHLLERRYNDELPTMITSNMGPNELSTYIDVRGVERLRENGGLMFALSGASRRAKSESTMVEEEQWWEKWLSNDPYSVTQRELRDDEDFSVKIGNYPGLVSTIHTQEVTQ